MELWTQRWDNWYHGGSVVHLLWKIFNTQATGKTGNHKHTVCELKPLAVLLLKHRKHRAQEC